VQKISRTQKRLSRASTAGAHDASTKCLGVDLGVGIHKRADKSPEMDNPGKRFNKKPEVLTYLGR